MPCSDSVYKKPLQKHLKTARSVDEKSNMISNKAVKPTNLFIKYGGYIEFDRRSAWNRCSRVKLEQCHNMDWSTQVLFWKQQWMIKRSNFSWNPNSCQVRQMQPLQVLTTTTKWQLMTKTVAVNDLSKKPVNEDNKAVPVAPAWKLKKPQRRLQ